MSNEAEKEIVVNENNNKLSTLQVSPQEELLGSVTTYTNAEGSEKNQQVRSSARVFKKIKLDSNAVCPTTSDKTISEKKEEPKIEPKKTIRSTNWSLEEKSLFFDAVNEYGKDFESIHTYLLQKIKKKEKGLPEPLVKSKEQIRYLYYRTWQKVSKYLKFSEGIEKKAQELYALVNYGEIRKKVGLNQKNCLKLNELIYNGIVNIRVKGKTVKVKTPMCRALRNLNKLDDKFDDVKFPSKVLVELRPQNMKSFLRVQNMALNPRIRALVPLQKRLSAFIGCISKRWKAAEVEYMNKNVLEEVQEENKELFGVLVNPRLKFSIPQESKVQRPSINISENYTNQSICLRAYEDRMGIVTSEYVLSLLNDKKDGHKKLVQKMRNSHLEKSPAKAESEKKETTSDIELLTHSENKAPENSRDLMRTTLSESLTNFSNVASLEKTVTGALDEAISNILLISNRCINEEINAGAHNVIGENVEENLRKKKIDEVSPDNAASSKQDLMYTDKLRNGWCLEDCDSLTIGELYLMFGTNSKITLEYSWAENDETSHTQNISDNLLACSFSDTTSQSTSTFQSCDHYSLGNSLQKLVSLAKLQYNKNKQKCSCGHVCSPKSSSAKNDARNAKGIIIIDNDEAPKHTLLHKNSSDETLGEVDDEMTGGANEDRGGISYVSEEFAHPAVKPPAPVHIMAQLDSIEKLKPKYCIRKGRRIMTKQVLVERELPLMPCKTSSAPQIVCMNIISKNDSARSSPVLNTLGSSANPTDTEMRYEEGDAGNYEPMEFENEEDIDRSETLSVLLQDASRSISPSGILKESDAQWISSEVGDFSLSSFLGHLDSPLKLNHNDESRMSGDVDTQMQSLLSETSFDYTRKFADFTNMAANDSI